MSAFLNWTKEKIENPCSQVKLLELWKAEAMAAREILNDTGEHALREVDNFLEIRGCYRQCRSATDKAESEARKQ